MYDILTLNKIATCGTSLFSDAYAVSDACDKPDAIMVRSAAMHDMDFAANTLAIARAGAGVNNIPLDKCTAAGIAVFNTPGANANAVKELVVCGLFLASRKIPAAMNWVNTLKGEGENVSKLVEKGKSQFVGPEIKGKTLGVIGLGAIGALVANAAVSLGMKVVGYLNPELTVRNALAISPEVVMVDSAEEVYACADYLTLHIPCIPSTKGCINNDTIATMKDGVRILNFARGELVDNAAILSALESGKVAAYVTDFPTDDQIGNPGVVAIPHLGASTPESEDNCAVMAAQELIAYLEKGEIVNSVNLPEMKLAAPKGKRICVIHEESALANVIASFGTNAMNVATASRKGISYTVADWSGDEAGIQADGVYRVRVIG
ncbi:MAG TPA: 3-phosphoglycerate dehydrogenase [Ruminococcaceae bacterium]|nr:3-phosphoglycerate dehydrogenase [Oscillospiraceae bacterium]